MFGVHLKHEQLSPLQIVNFRSGVYSALQQWLQKNKSLQSATKPLFLNHLENVFITRKTELLKRFV